MEGRRSFKQAREDAVYFIECNVESYEKAKNGSSRTLKEIESDEALGRIRFACMLGLISCLEANDYYIRIDKEYLIEKRA